MYAFIGEVLKFFKRQFLFCSLFIILICLLAVTQYQYWLGDYNREGLINLKEEIALVELERQIIENDNQRLIEEKEKLNSFIFLGDNVYGDDDSGNLNKLKGAYIKQKKLSSL